MTSRRQPYVDETKMSSATKRNGHSVGVMGEILARTSGFPCGWVDEGRTLGRGGHNGAAFQHPDAQESIASDARECLLFFAIIGFVLDNRRRAEQGNRGSWNKTVDQIQLVSLEACRVWRGTTSVHLRVAAATPPCLWKKRGREDETLNEYPPPVNTHPYDSEGTTDQRVVSNALELTNVGATDVMSRVSKVHVTRITWDRSTRDLCDNIGAVIFEDVRTITFGRLFDESLTGVLWPERCNVKRIVFGYCFDQPLFGASWPPALAEIKFGGRFNQELGRVQWPKTLRKLELGDRFNRTITDPAWPPVLETIIFGEEFNKGFDGVPWPPSLRKLVFGWRFNSVLTEGELPDTLQHLEFGGVFDKPLSKLPAALKNFTLSSSFDQPIGSLKLPGGLEEVVFGVRFNQPVDAVEWPDTVEKIYFGGYEFNQPIDAVKWPVGLRKLTFGHSFNQSLTNATFSGGVQEISFGEDFDKPLSDVTWPTGLKHICLAGNHPGQFDGASSCWPPFLTKITLDGEFNQPLGSVSWPATLHELIFGWRFNQALNGVSWPRSLKTLTFGGSFDQPVECVVLPGRLKHLAFVQNSTQKIEGLALPETVRTLTVGCAPVVDMRLLRKGVAVRRYDYHDLIEMR